MLRTHEVVRKYVCQPHFFMTKQIHLINYQTLLTDRAIHEQRRGISGPKIYNQSHDIENFFKEPPNPKVWTIYIIYGMISNLNMEV